MGTTLTRTGLVRPASGDTSWATNVNAWWDKLDTYGGFTDLTATWSAVQTFSSVVISAGTAALSTLTFQKDSNTITPSGVVYVGTSNVGTGVTADLNGKTLGGSVTTGRVLHVHSAGTYTASASPSLTYRVSFGGAVAGSVALTPSTNGSYCADFWITVRSAGAPGTAQCSGTFSINNGGTTYTTGFQDGTSSPTTTGTPIVKTHVVISGTATITETTCVMEMLG